MQKNTPWILYFRYPFFFIHTYPLLISAFTNLPLTLLVLLNMLLPNLIIQTTEQLSIMIALHLLVTFWTDHSMNLTRKTFDHKVFGNCRWLLSAEKLVYLQLSPGKVNALLVFITSLCPPKSSSHNTSYEIGVITLSHVKLVRHNEVFRCSHIEPVTIVHFPKQISVHLYFV